MSTKNGDVETILLDGKPPKLPLRDPKLPLAEPIKKKKDGPVLAATPKEARNVRKAVQEVRRADDLEAAKSLMVLYIRGRTVSALDMLAACFAFQFSPEIVADAEKQLGIEQGSNSRRLPKDFTVPPKLRELLRCSRKQILDEGYKIPRPEHPKAPVSPRERVLKMLGQRNGLRYQEFKVPSGVLADLEAEGAIKAERKRGTNYWHLTKNFPRQVNTNKKKRKKKKVNNTTAPADNEPFSLAMKSMMHINDRSLFAIALDATECRISVADAKSALEGYLFVEEYAAEHDQDGDTLITQILTGLHRSAVILQDGDDYLISPRGFRQLEHNPLKVTADVMEFIYLPTTDEDDISSLIAESRHLREVQDLCKAVIRDLGSSGPHKRLMGENSKRIAVLRGSINALKPKVLVEA